jgi:hypothetical protein
MYVMYTYNQFPNVLSKSNIPDDEKYARLVTSVSHNYELLEYVQCHVSKRESKDIYDPRDWFGADCWH